MGAFLDQYNEKINKLEKEIKRFYTPNFELRGICSGF